MEFSHPGADVCGRQDDAMITAGVTAVGGGVGHSVLQALRNSQFALRTIGMDVRRMSAGLYWVDSAHLVPPAGDRQAYVESILEICAREHVDVLIPGSDPELKPLAEAQARFLDQGVAVIVSAPEAVGLCRNKLLLAHHFRGQSLPFVDTYTAAEAQERADQLAFPLIAKPRGGSGSVGARVLYRREDLLSLPAEADLIVQPYLPPRPMDLAGSSGRGIGGRLDQTNEISIQFYVGTSGRILGRLGSVNRLKDGVPLEIVPDSHCPGLAEAQCLVEELARVGLRGPVNLQGRVVSEGVKFFEINPRYTGLTGVRSRLGYHEVDAGIWDFLMGREDEAQRCLSYHPGFVALRYVADSIVPATRIELVSSGEQARETALGDLPSRIFVTGASGYVGSNLVRLLLQTPGVEQVRVGVRSEAAAGRLQQEVGDSSKYRQHFGKLPDSPWDLSEVDVLVHLAALRPSAAGPEGNRDIFWINVEGTRRLIEKARAAGVSRLVFLSSQAVYGTRRPPAWSEGLPAQPETVYGLSKWLGEQACMSEALGLEETVVLRPARVYGLGSFIRWEELPHKFARLAAKGEPLPIHGGGRDRVDLVHVRDLCHAILRACTVPMSHNRRQVLNVGSGQSASVVQVAATCREAAKGLGLTDPGITHVGDKAGVERHFGMDIQRGQRVLGWSPKVSLADGFHELIHAALVGRAAIQ